MNIQTKVPTHNVDTMALRYKNAKDEFDTISESELQVFRQLINQQFHDINKRVRAEFVDYEPYGENPTLAAMLPDFRSGVIKIHTTGNESLVWNKFHNLQFRFIHDYLHLVHEHDFTHYEECKVYPKQFEFSIRDKYTQLFPNLNWDTYNRILRSEIVYQSSYKEVYGQFHILQKVILSNL